MTDGRTSPYGKLEILRIKGWIFKRLLIAWNHYICTVRQPIFHTEG